jgi:hypothetical protein
MAFIGGTPPQRSRACHKWAAGEGEDRVAEQFGGTGGREGQPDAACRFLHPHRDLQQRQADGGHSALARF